MAQRMGVLMLAVAALCLSPAVLAQGGPGKVLVGQHGFGQDLVLTDAERAAATEEATGELAGIVASSTTSEFSTALDGASRADLESLGFTVEVCDASASGAYDPGAAVACLDGFIEAGASVVTLAGTAPDWSDSVGDAIAGGAIVVQVVGDSLGDLGAVVVEQEATHPSTALGSAAGQYASVTWADEAVGALILADPDHPDYVSRAEAIEAALTAAHPGVTVVGHRLGLLPEDAAKSLRRALKDDPDLRLVLAVTDAGGLGAYEAAGDAEANLAFFSIGSCGEEVLAAIEEGRAYKGCVDANNPADYGHIAAAAVGKLLAGSDVPGSLDVPVSVFVPALGGVAPPTVAVPVDTPEPGSPVPEPQDSDVPAACAERVAMLPAEVEGEPLGYEFVTGREATGSLEFRLEYLMRLAQSSQGSDVSEDSVCLVRFAYGDGSLYRGTLWDVDGRFFCSQSRKAADCPAETYVATFTQTSIVGSKGKATASRPKIGGRKVIALKLPSDDFYDLRVGPDFPARDVYVVRTGDTFATFSVREAAEAIVPLLPAPTN